MMCHYCGGALGKTPLHCACAKYGYTQHDPSEVEWCSEECMDKAHPA